MQKSALLGPVEIRQLAEKLGVTPTKKLGQNFVHDPNTVRRIVAAAELSPDDHVIEVGPGLGSLTLALLDSVAEVTAVEIDPRLAAELPQTAADRSPDHADKLKVVVKDALQITRAEVGQPTALVANLPYNVSVPVLLHLLEEFPSIRRVLVMVQAEVADRLAARPGSKVYGVPSAKAAFYGTVRRAGAIGKNVFWPAPKIESGLVRIDRFDTPPWPEAVRARTFSLIDAAFAQRRKTLRAALAGMFGASISAETALVGAGIDPMLRGEKLGVADFVRLASAMVAVGHAKTNLFLAVGQARPDGYHELTTVFQSLALADVVTATPASGAPGVLKLTGEGIPTDESNLVWKAASAAGIQQAVNVHVDKQIPVAGGMAGGSADAAAMLRIVEKLQGINPDDFAAQLGADVPFTLHGGTMLGTGVGADLTPVQTTGTYHWVAVPNPKGLSTPEVFRKLDELRASESDGIKPADPKALLAALAAGDVERVAQHLHNDLQPAAIALLPELRATLDAGTAAGALAGIVSGSGPTCVFLCRDAEHARQVAARLRPDYPEALVTFGPAAGAQVVEMERS